MGSTSARRPGLRRTARLGALLVAVASLSACGVLAPRPAADDGVASAGAFVGPPEPPQSSASNEPVPIAPAPPVQPALAPAPLASRSMGGAQPRVERIPSGAPNRPYVVKGELYVPENADVPMREVGIASWYGYPFHGRKASNGERYDMEGMTAAHPTMPLPSYARVRNLANGREVIVRVNDRGPFHGGRVIDLSRAAARKLGFSGLALVQVERLTHDEIRVGAWRRPAEPQPLAANHAAAVKKGRRIAASTAAPRQQLAAE